MEIWIRTRPTETFALGQSRIGGVPELPVGTPWPRHWWARDEVERWPEHARSELADAIARGEVIDEGDRLGLALPFVAQLALTELAAFDPRLARPGHLWLFADQQTTLGEIGHYPYQACACLYAADAALVRATPPPTPETLPALALTFARASGEQLEPRHALLPETFQGVIGDVPPPGYQGLLRIDSDYTLAEPLNWGDAAWITFALPAEAFASGRFDEVRAFRFCG